MSNPSLCQSCFRRPPNVTFNCGHVLYCDQCWGVKISLDTCPVCNAEILSANISNSGQKSSAQPYAQPYAQSYGQPSHQSQPSYTHPSFPSFSTFSQPSFSSHQPSHAQQPSLTNPHPDFYGNTGQPTSSQQYLLGIGNTNALKREREVENWLAKRLNPYGMASSQSPKDKILAMSGKWTGFSKPSDASKPPTEWANTIVNFAENPEDPNKLTISGRGSSLFQGEEIHFHLAGTVDTKSFAFELFKTHTGRFVHTLVYRGVMDPDVPVMSGSFAGGRVRLERGSQVNAALVPPGQRMPNAAHVPPANPIRSWRNRNQELTNENWKKEESWASRAMSIPYSQRNSAVAAKKANNKEPGSSGGSRKTRQKRSVPKKSRRKSHRKRR